MKKNLSKKIVLGVCSAAFISAQVLAFADSVPPASQTTDMPMTADEQAFVGKLSDSAKDAFKKMNHDQRTAAMKMAAHDCKGKNDCKGKGGCKTEANDCAGKNDCKGKGACKVTADKAVNTCQQMCAKRASL